jgi:hypothetical protein
MLWLEAKMETSGIRRLRDRAPLATLSGTPEVPGRVRRLQLVIPYTTRELTEAALKAAGPMVEGLGAMVSMVYVQVVPYPRSLEEPDVASEHLKARIEQTARESAVPVRAEVVYARDRAEAFRQVLRPGSLVLLATRKRWWATAEERLGRLLLRAGHSVALVAV